MQKRATPISNMYLWIHNFTSLFSRNMPEKKVSPVERIARNLFQHIKVLFITIRQNN